MPWYLSLQTEKPNVELPLPETLFYGSLSKVPQFLGGRVGMHIRDFRPSIHVEASEG